ncbi:protein yellow-like [Cloeon dipterum]|uniref:protein yellow-like n=1 Tax=Cloeon dipterum TaxID=197152 RepID=UPI00321FA38A
MSSFFAAIFLLGLCLANAINFTTVYEWDKLDFVWPSGADPSIGQMKRNFNPKGVEFRYMAVFGERLFLSLDNTILTIPATLVWLPTSGTSTSPPKLAPFPSWNLHKRDNCDSIQQAKGLETDHDGRLWVLDQGSKKCPSKIWIFNLLRNDKVEHVYQFLDAVVTDSYIGRELREIAVEKTPDDYFAYITAYYSDQIMVYSRKTDKSWSVKTTDVWWEALALSPNREGRRLYLGTFVYNQLFSVSVSELRNGGAGSAAVESIGVTQGAAYRMLIDSANVLYAGLRSRNDLFIWNTSEPYPNEIFHEHGMQGAFWPLTFALDANGILWMTQRNETSGGNRHKLLKAAVGARKYLLGTPTDLPSRG